MAFKYNDGDAIGSNGFILIKRTRKDERGQWLGIVRCPHCNKEAEKLIGPICHDIVKSCGCNMASSQFKKKWQPGDLIGPNKIKFLGYTGEKDTTGASLGKFECRFCGNEYIARISRVSSGEGRQECGCQEPLRRKLVGEKNAAKIAGQRFGRLVAIEPTGESDESNNRYWRCKCDCGNETIVPTGRLISGITRSCGCLSREISARNGRANAKDISGQKFGLLTAIRRDGTVYRGKQKVSAATWYCECECGGSISHVAQHDLTSGNTKSCGCLCSYGETAMKRALKDAGIAYEPQKTFDDCINPATGKNLFFDFYLPDYDILIEYDGKQHFSFKENARQFDRQQFLTAGRRDLIKNDWVASHNATLVRIPYTYLDDIDAEFVQDIVERAQVEGSFELPLPPGTKDMRAMLADFADEDCDLDTEYED